MKYTNIQANVNAKKIKIKLTPLENNICVNNYWLK